jgi:hypothetical protein
LYYSFAFHPFINEFFLDCLNRSKLIKPNHLNLDVLCDCLLLFYYLAIFSASLVILELFKPTVKRSVFVLVVPFLFFFLFFLFFLSHVNLIQTNQFLRFNNWFKNQLLAGPFI